MLPILKKLIAEGGTMGFLNAGYLFKNLFYLYLDL